VIGVSVYLTMEIGFEIDVVLDFTRTARWAGLPDDEEWCKDWREASTGLGQRDVSGLDRRAKSR
jgi:hypothetical protein